MPLPTRLDLQTLDIAGRGGPAAILEAKALSTGTLDYADRGGPVFAAEPPPPTYVYRGTAGWAAIYKGVLSDAALYKGAKVLHA